MPHSPAKSIFGLHVISSVHTHTIYHTQLCHTPSFTHQLCHTPSFTHNFVTHYLSHTTLSHTIFHTQLSPTIFHTQLCHTLSFTQLAWQAWHLVTSTFVSRGKHGTWSHSPSFCVAGVALMALGWLWWRAWTGLVAGDTAALCVAGVALGDIHLRFAWQAWHLVTSTFVLRGRRGTGLALVARLGRF